MGKKIDAVGDDLAGRCRAYLEAGPPKGMKDYVAGSVAEIIIGCGAKKLAVDAELRELGELVVMEAEGFDAYGDAAVRAYLKRGAGLVGEVLRRG